MLQKIFFTILPFIVMMLGMLFFSSWIVYRAFSTFGIIRAGISNTIWLGLLFLPLVLVGCMIVYNYMYSPILSAIYIISVTWIPILIYLFLGSVILSILYFLGTLFGFQVPIYALSIILIIISLGATGYGIINATIPRVNTFTVESTQLAPLWKDKKIVLVSDMHLGIVRSKHFMQRVVDLINTQKPDVVLIAGDIIDGPKFPYGDGLSPLRDLDTPLGVFYTPGNHEGYNQEKEKFYDAVRPLVTTLIDQREIINGTQIIGLDYKIEGNDDTHRRLDTAGYEKNMPSIVIMHDPKNVPALRDADVSLVVSGHTHCGQFFPMNLVVRAMYKSLTYGVTKVGSTSTVTTCGVGTAMSPLRLGTNPEIVVIKITE